MFGKLFGWLKRPAEVDSYDPPEATAPVPAAEKRSARPQASKALPPDKSAKGFDPYNSGAFKRQNAWEKVPRL